MNFKNMPKDQLDQFRIKAWESRRSEAHQRAWENIDQIRKEAKTKTIAQLAHKYQVNNRTMRRWITGK